MNINDVATEVEERHREESLALARRNAEIQPTLRPTGKCLWCFTTIDPTSANPRFCDAEHRDEYDHFMSRHPELLRPR